MQRRVINTGYYELNVKDLTEKLGSMALSTKCCATGTCKTYTAQNIRAPLIPMTRDKRDAFSFIQKFGYLV